MISNFPFPTFNIYQKETLQLIENSFKIYDTIILEAPTGFGKSPISYAVSKYFKNSYIITNQKSLQNQYINDFSISKIEGRSNFICLNNNEKCSNGECKQHTQFRCDYALTLLETNNFAGISEKRGNLYWKSDIHCPYWEQKINAMNDNFAIPNYSYLLTELKYVKDLSKRNVLICDEGHNIEKQLLSFINVKISALNIQNISNSYFPNFNESDVSNWIKWAMNLSSDIKERIKELKNSIDSGSHLKHLHAGELKSLEKIKSKLDYLFSVYQNNPQNWIINIEKYKNTTSGVEFKPLFINNFSNDLLFQYGAKKLIMSATILNKNKLIESLGLNPATTGFIQIPSSFNPLNQPIYHLNIGKINAKTLNENDNLNMIQPMVDAIDTLLDIFKNQKGIIHTTTYKIANQIKERTRHKTRILIHEPSNRIEILNQHIESDEPTVLCSPSMTEGVDLKDDLSRFQILVKVPYPYLGDKIIKKRMELDREYYDWLTCLEIVQSKGRSIRSINDMAITFTLDTGFINFCKNNNNMLKDNFNTYARPIEEFASQYGKYINKSIEEHPNNTNWIKRYLK